MPLWKLTILGFINSSTVMKQASTSIGRYLIILLVLLSAPSSSNLFAQTTAKPFKKLVWSDEFNGKGLPDSTKWGYDVGRGCPQKTSGAEKQNWPHRLSGSRFAGGIPQHQNQVVAIA